MKALMREPTHVVERVGDPRSMCGVKDPLPVIWAPFVQRHVDGYGMVLCPACAEKMGDKGGEVLKAADAYDKWQPKGGD